MVLEPPAARLAHHPIGDTVVCFVDTPRDYAGIAPHIEVQVVVPVEELREVPARLPHPYALGISSLQPPARGERAEGRVALRRVDEEHHEAALEHLAGKPTRDLARRLRPTIVVGLVTNPQLSNRVAEPGGEVDCRRVLRTGVAEAGPAWCFRGMRAGDPEERKDDDEILRGCTAGDPRHPRSSRAGRAPGVRRTRAACWAAPAGRTTR